MLDVLRIFKGKLDTEERGLVGNKNLLLLSLQKQEDDEETSEWIGFVQTMKIFIKRSFAFSNNRMDVQIDQVKH